MQILSAGETGPLVAFVRTRLDQLGFGPLLGGDALDAPALDALSRFQDDRQLVEPGQVGDATWLALLDVDLHLGEAGLSFYRTGQSVVDPLETAPIPPDGAGMYLQEVQLRLRALGYPCRGETTNGPLTQHGLRAFQASQYLEVTGSVDSETLLALRVATRDAGPLFLYVEDGSLEPSTQPIAFGAEFRDVVGDGGYTYRQYEDGAITIIVGPSPRALGTTLRAGAAWQAITAEIGSYPRGTAPLAQGARGDAVRQLQARLRALGVPLAAVNGTYDDATEAAVRAFQQEEGLPVTGQIDAITRGHLLGAQGTALPDAIITAERARLADLLAPGLAALAPADAARVGAVLTEAIAWVGKREIPNGSNGGPEVEVITAGSVPAGQPLPPWCALAISYWLRVGLHAATWKETPLGVRNASALAFGRWGEAQGRLLPASGPAPAGSIFVMYREGSGSDAGKRAEGAGRWEGTGHTGMVVADLGDRVVTVDGNIGDRCWSATRPKAGLLGFVRWW